MAQKKATTSFWEGQTGLVGTLAIQLVDINNIAIVSRTTAGVVEFPAGSGLYEYPYTEPSVGYNWIFDDGTDYDSSEFTIPVALQTIAPATLAAASSQTTITQRFSISNVATDMQSVTFGDSTGTLGIVRTDTNTNVVAPGTPLAHTGTGIYSFTFPDPALGLTYQYYITVVTPTGATQYLPVATKQGGSGAIAGYYTTQALIEQRAGSYNADLWSNRGDGSSTAPDSTGFVDALGTVDAFINRLARKNDYVSPIPTTSKDWAYLQDKATDYGLAMLYIKARGLHDNDPVGKNIASIGDQAKADLEAMFAEDIDAASLDAQPVAAVMSVNCSVPCGVPAISIPAARSWPWPF